MWVLRLLSRRRSEIAAAAVGLSAVGLTAGDGEGVCPPSRPPYATLRYEEDWSFLRDTSCRTDPLDGLKYVPLGRGSDVYLSTGADACVKYESFGNALNFLNTVAMFGGLCFVAFRTAPDAHP